MLGTCHIFVDASRVASSCSFTDALRVNAEFFRHFSPCHCRFASRVINFQLLKFVSRYGLTLLVVKLSPLHPAVILTPPHPAIIFHPSCWRSNSTLYAQRSSSTLPIQWSFSTNSAAGQTLASPPSGHPPLRLVANLTPNHPAVIFLSSF